MKNKGKDGSGKVKVTKKHAVKKKKTVSHGEKPAVKPKAVNVPRTGPCSTIQTFNTLEEALASQKKEPKPKKPVAEAKLGKYVCVKCGKSIEILSGASATCSCGGTLREVKEIV